MGRKLIFNIYLWKYQLLSRQKYFSRTLSKNLLLNAKLSQVQSFNLIQKEESYHIKIYAKFIIGT